MGLAGDLRLMRAMLAGELGELERRRSDRKDYAAPALALIDPRQPARVAGPDGDRRDAGLPAAGLARGLDDVAAAVRAIDHRPLLQPPTSLAEAAARLDMNQDFDHDRILSTAAHEAMPGQFLQLSIAHRQPDLVRKLQDASSFAEGWAYYGEEMFVRLGLYGDHLDGRLFTARWEQVRGARAIVDAELASGAWTIDRAVEFYERESGFTHEAAQAAVAGMALNPGYAIAYIVGRDQLETLLAEVMRRRAPPGAGLRPGPCRRRSRRRAPWCA
ncbi:MAG: DUF885 family protein [Burkholderiales bacterium]|nr:DUF885 family protein [Burkholderiales bacterium]MDE1927787.1 DUF885 family protein [Burkholderiales bacterium]MDE2158148.1 DUF885 family protein [Burkholderiales bacterium]MDE2504132.1 DUF885 family protein [Burkholderiales bacterium]